MNTTSPRYRLSSEQSRTTPQESWWLKSWRYMHWLSLDVALGAGLSAEWVNHAWQGQSSIWVSLAIMSAALCVYSLDHWADARRAALRPVEQLSKRRLFYVHSQAILLLLSAVSIFSGLWAASHLSLPLLFLGLGVFLVCACYLWSIQNKQNNKRTLSYSKEVIVTSVYALALSLWPMSQIFDSTVELSLINGLLTSVLIFNFAWANVCLISVHERRQDAAEDLPSMALSLGEYTTKNIGRGLLRLSLILCFVRMYVQWISPNLSPVNLILDNLVSLGMTFTLWRLYQRPEWSKVRERYRRWADAVFLYPVLMWFLI
ncbi:MAG: hypothetical protein CMH49_03245 [Myxococcales bacterium]|nr:hypothetical protein [Myxococcales bacterium]